MGLHASYSSSLGSAMPIHMCFFMHDYRATINLCQTCVGASVHLILHV